MYASGQGVEKNFVEAYAYLNLAVTNGFQPAVMLRDGVGKRLSEEQLARAQTRMNQLQAEFLERRTVNESKR
jgi:TPR repeat protein